MEEKIATTDYTPGEQYFVLPYEVWPNIRLEIFNASRKEWRKSDFTILIKPNGKKKKTDKQIKLYYSPLKEKIL